MKEETAVRKMREIAKDDYAETAHGNADDLLCRFLEELGYKRLVKMFGQVRKWYS